MKSKSVLLVLFLSLLTLLAANQQSYTEEANASLSLDSRISAFAKTIAGSDELARPIADVLQTLPGRVALAQILTQFENESLLALRLDGLAKFFETSFVNKDEKLTVADSSDPFWAWFREEFRNYSSDVGMIAASLAEVERKFTATGELDKWFKEFLQNPLAPLLIYQFHLYRYVQPNPVSLMSGGIFVDEVDGMRVAYNGKARSQEKLARFNLLCEEFDKLCAAYLGLLDRLSKNDPVTASLASLLGKPDFVMYLMRLVEVRKDAQDDVAGYLLNVITGRLAEVDGMLVVQDGTTIRGIINSYLRNIYEQRQILTGAAGFAERINPDDPDFPQWTVALNSPLSPLLCPQNQQTQRPSVADLLNKSWFGRTISRGGAGYVINIHSYYETDFWISELFQKLSEYEPLRDAAFSQGLKVEDQSLRDMLISQAGRMILAVQATKLRQSGDFDPFTAWRDKHFAPSGNGYAPRKEASASLKELLDSAEAVAKELNTAKAVSTINPATLGYSTTGLDLLRSSAFFNPRTASGAYYYDASVPDHFATRRFGFFDWSATSSKNREEFSERVQSYAQWIKRDAENCQKLIVVIGGMPQWLSKSTEAGTFEGGRRKNTEAYPPKDVEQWCSLVREAVEVLKTTTHATRYYEFWNEPDLEYWQDDLDSFLELYAITAKTIKDADPEGRVGGCAPNSWNGKIKKSNERDSVVQELIRYVSANNLPLDFVSWHHFGKPVEAIQEATDAIRDEIAKCGLPNRPELLVTEWSPPALGTPYAVSGMCNLMAGFFKAQVDAQTIACVEEFQADVENGSTPPYGMISQAGIKKNTWSLHVLFDRLARDSEGVAVEENMVVSRKAGGIYDIILYGHGNSQKLQESLDFLAANGINNTALQTFQTMPRLEAALRTGIVGDERLKTIFAEVSKYYLAHPVQTERLVVTFAGAKKVEVLASNSVLMRGGPKEVYTSGNTVTCPVSCQEAIRLLVKVE